MSITQRASALQIANERRSASAELKRSLRDMHYRDAWVEAARLLRDCPESVQYLELHEFLLAVPKIGRERMRRICTKNPQVWPFRRVGELTVRERERLAERVGESGGWSFTPGTERHGAVGDPDLSDLGSFYPRLAA